MHLHVSICICIHMHMYMCTCRITVYTYVHMYMAIIPLRRIAVQHRIGTIPVVGASSKPRDQTKCFNLGQVQVPGSRVHAQN